MASHQDWQEEVIAEHNRSHPFAPENGNPLQFAPGDHVIYTNDQGIEFELKVSFGYLPDPIDSLYARGYRYLLDCSSHWMPVKESSLRANPIVAPI